jgi:hypothetical protein
MSLFTRLLVLVVAVAFLTAGLVALLQGAYGAAAGGLGFGSFVALIGGMGWFETKYPLPPLPKGERASLIGEAQRYLIHHPGIPGKVAAGFIALGLLLALVVAIARLVR